jgi:hypothetical protein
MPGQCHIKMARKSIGALAAPILNRKLTSPFWRLPEGDRTPIQYAAQLRHFDAASELQVTEKQAGQERAWKETFYHVDAAVAVIELVVRLIFPDVYIGDAK